MGKEQGLMGRFGQNVCYVMSEVNLMCSLPIHYADYQVGQTSVERGNYRSVLDLILIDDQHGIRAVGEGKTFWTRDLTDVKRDLFALWLGRPYSYLLGMKLVHSS